MKGVSTLLMFAIASAVLQQPAGAAEETKTAAPKPPAGPGGTPGGTAPAETLGTVGSWSAYMFKQKGGRVCYLIGQPEKSNPAGAKRGQPTAMVTHRPEEKTFNVVSFNEGYPLKAGSDATVDVGAGKFTLFTKDESAWAATSDLDKEIVGALAKGKRAVVIATSQKGTTTTDSYSLVGFSKALELIDAACGVKR